ncbi:extracellular solute-binding protein [Sinomonas sp. ASV486]|uniref:ABC transporter substrate-binding protein n=1 Tax=Sinomonas sp. ASV486 TaxID=3051170 RepID=UPI0027DACD12|nr:extracellular solute-binding protein [Sinomonas sp. ASV486]MDQ4492067.1 extracellular solute-binding protein [Sinomonas sp. ASV486]
MHKKSLLALSVAVAVAVGLSACSGGSSSSASGDGKTLTIAATTNEKPALDAVVAKFKEQNPGVDVKYTTSALDQYQTTTRTQLSSGTAPDVVFVWPGDGNPMATRVVAKAGYLEDLSGQSWANSFPAGIKPVTQYNGKTYSASVTFSGIGAVYNMTAMNQAGLTPPTTWSGLLQFCTQAKDKGKTAFELGAQTNWVTQLVPYSLTPTLVYGPNPNFPQDMADKKATFADSKWTDAMNKYLEMQKAGCFQANPLGTDYNASLAAVAKGDALSVVQVNSAVAAISQQAPQGTQLNMLPVPATDSASDTRMAGAAGSTYGVNAKAKNKDLAIKFVNFLESPDGMNLYAQTNKALPAVPNDSFKVDPALSTLQQHQKDGKTDAFMDQNWPNARVQQTLFQVVQDLLAGKTDVATGLKQMDSAYSQGS